MLMVSVSMSGSKPKNIFGERFGRLVAIEMVGRKGSRIMWRCKCECGGEKVASGVDLRRGTVNSCGCIKGEGIQLRHGHNRRGKRSRTYNSWHHMRQRCNNPNSHKWDDYGGRGIKVCDRWQDSFDNFLEDMGECPHNCTIDRIDNDGDYTPENCRWATAKTQSRNTRRNVYFTHGGETLHLREWAKRTGISADTLNMRRLRGWSDEEIVTTQLGKRTR